MPSVGKGSDFLYCKDKIFQYIALSTTNILSYFIFLPFYFVTDILMFTLMAYGVIPWYNVLYT